MSFLFCTSSGILQPGPKVAKPLKWVPCMNRGTYKRSLQRSPLVLIQGAGKGLLIYQREWEKSPQCYPSTPYLLHLGLLKSPMLLLAVVTVPTVRAHMCLKLWQMGKLLSKKGSCGLKKAGQNSIVFFSSFHFSSVVWLQKWVESQKVNGRVR